MHNLSEFPMNLMIRMFSGNSYLILSHEIERSSNICIKKLRFFPFSPDQCGISARFGLFSVCVMIPETFNGILSELITFVHLYHLVAVCFAQELSKSEWSTVKFVSTMKQRQTIKSCLLWNVSDENCQWPTDSFQKLVFEPRETIELACITIVASCTTH